MDLPNNCITQKYYKHPYTNPLLNPTSRDKINLILNMVCPGGGLRLPHPHLQSAASAASGNGFIFRKWGIFHFHE